MNKSTTSLMVAKAKRELRRREVLTEYSDDFNKFSKEQLKILPKDVSKGYVAFEMNRAQQLIHDKIEEQRQEKGNVRAIILKARQQGISTYAAGRAYWRTSHSAYTKTVVLAHDSNTSDQLFDMTRNFISSQPEAMRPEFSKSTGKELKYKDNDSSYRVYTAGSPEAGRGTTPTLLHGSEVAFWPHDDKVLAGLFQGVSNAPGTEIILESTANGASGEFYRLFKEGEEGKNQFIAIFIPWFMTDEYVLPVPKGFERTYEEDAYGAKYELTDGQVYWRRMKIAESGEEKFKQEYPANSEEAFLVSGSAVFSLDKLNEHIIKKPVKVHEYDTLTNSWDPCSYGSLEIWYHPRHDDTFVIGADVAGGVGKDYSAAVVMSPDGEIAALFRNNTIDPGTFGDVLFYLGRMFNNCLIVCESNNHGAATLHQLVSMNYPTLYYQTRIQQISKETTSKPGFQTTVSTKPTIIAGLSRAIKDNTITIPSNIILDECKNYISRENGRMEAAPNKNDDTVISTALALEGLRTHSDKLSGFIDWSKYKQLESVSETINWL